MDEPTEGAPRARLYLEHEELLEHLDWGAHGEAAVLSVRSPIKQVPNEDGALIAPLAEGGVVLAVADGVGGQPSARHASRATLESIARALDERARSGVPAREAILAGIERANEEVVDTGSGSATTLVAVQVEGTRARTFHVGDSRAMVFDAHGGLRHLTIAHSPVGYAVEAGVLDEEEAIDHEQRHLVSNVVGDPGMHVAVSAAFELGPTDTIVVATDGLFDNLHLGELVELLRHGPLGQRVRELAAECRARMLAPGGPRPSKPDDLTLVAFRPGPRRG